MHSDLPKSHAFLADGTEGATISTTRTWAITSALVASAADNYRPGSNEIDSTGTVFIQPIAEAQETNPASCL